MPEVLCTVLSERKNEFRGKNGFQSKRLLTLLDNTSKKGARLRVTFEHDMSEEEKVKFPVDTLTGKIISFGLTNVMSFNGRLGFEGSVLEVVPGKAA